MLLALGLGLISLRLEMVNGDHELRYRPKLVDVA
jgi:hypothetical protein